MDKAYLVLSDGSVFAGTRIGAPGDCVGELVFATGMVGYLETLTDPGYAGQIVMQTFPMIGNYGVMEADFEGDCALRGYVVRELCTGPSNFRSQYDLDTLLKNKGIPGICGLDTRVLTTYIREHGVTNAAIVSELPADLDAIRAYRVSGEVEKVGRKAMEIFPAEGERRFVTGETLAETEARLDPAVFFRCHKSYIVNLNKIRSIEPYGRWTYIVKLEGTKQDALITHEKYEELEHFFT